MTTAYKILFSVELLHQYYADGKCRDVALVPSEATRKRMQDGRMLWKVQDNELLVLIQTGSDGKPNIPLAADVKFVFYLQLLQLQLLTVTNMDADLFNDQRFYFFNLSNNKSGNSLHLSRPIVPYQSSVHYYPGIFTLGPGEIVFECIKENPAGAGVSRNTADEAFWMARSGQPFVSAADMVPFADSIMRLRVAEAATYSVHAFGVNKANNRAYTVAMPIAQENPLSVADTPTPGVKEVQADFSALPPGRYLLGVNELQKEVYVDNAADAARYFGVVEIFNHLPGNDSFALLDEDGKVKQTGAGEDASWLRYTIRFANRLAFFKYISRNRGVEHITDGRPVGPRQFSFALNPVPPPLPLPPPNTSLFLSNKPVPLQQGLDFFNLALPAVFGSATLKAPNPDPAAPGVLHKYQNDYFYTIMLQY